MPIRATSRAVSYTHLDVYKRQLGGRGISTRPELVEAICERLQQAGIRAGEIVVWDRDSDELERAGFHLSTEANRVQCLGTDRAGYEQDLASFGSVGSRLSKILTQRTHVLINVPVLKDHDGAGVTLSLIHISPPQGAKQDGVSKVPQPEDAPDQELSLIHISTGSAHPRGCW